MKKSFQKNEGNITLFTLLNPNFCKFDYILIMENGNLLPYGHSYYDLIHINNKTGVVSLMTNVNETEANPRHKWIMNSVIYLY